ncbi:MAG: hypothetical protein Q8P74_01900 [bacterium]|nr:hypothetical protein [bacterium]
MPSSERIMTFGEVFNIGEKDYVYLIEYNDITYAARILDEHTSGILNNIYEKKKANGNLGLEEKSNFCFVMLTTVEVENRAAHLAIDADHEAGTLPLNSPFCSLDRDDLKMIVREIKDGPVAENLKKAFEIYSVESI